MQMPRPSEQAKAAFAELVPSEPTVTIKPMFGQVSAFVNGNMFCGLWGDELVVRLPEADLARIKQEGGRDFEPMAGHKMGGYAVVGGDWRGRGSHATALVRRALEIAREMPAKGAKGAAGTAGAAGAAGTAGAGRARPAGAKSQVAKAAKPKATPARPPQARSRAPAKKR
jgi:TfoX/Sxy family transcriptional regulator of competence genes